MLTDARHHLRCLNFYYPNICWKNDDTRTALARASAGRAVWLLADQPNWSLLTQGEYFTGHLCGRHIQAYCTRKHGLTKTLRKTRRRTAEETPLKATSKENQNSIPDKSCHFPERSCGKFASCKLRVRHILLCAAFGMCVWYRYRINKEQWSSGLDIIPNTLGGSYCLFHHFCSTHTHTLSIIHDWRE